MKNLTVWVGILALCLMTGARADEGNVLAKRALAKTHNPRAALATLLAQLKTYPHDEALRLAIIRVAARVRPAPRIPNDARRHMGHGLAAFGLAKAPQDYLPAIHEFQQASNRAPWWPDPYYDLAKAQEQFGDDQGAVTSFQNYLAAAPHAQDAGEVRTELYKVQYLAQQKAATPTAASAHVISLTCSFYEYLGHPETIGSPYLENNKLYVWIRVDRKQAIVKTHMFYRTPHGRLIPTPTYTYTNSVRITPSEYRANGYSIDRTTGVLDWGIGSAVVGAYNCVKTGIPLPLQLQPTPKF